MVSVWFIAFDCTGKQNGGVIFNVIMFFSSGGR